MVYRNETHWDGVWIWRYIKSLNNGTSAGFIATLIKVRGKVVPQEEAEHPAFCFEQLGRPMELQRDTRCGQPTGSPGTEVTEQVMYRINSDRAWTNPPQNAAGPRASVR